MHPIIYIVIGVLVGSIATLFSDVYNWKVFATDLGVASLGAWQGGAASLVLFHAVDPGPWPIESILACLICSSAAVAAWRAARTLWRNATASAPGRAASAFPM